MRIRNAVSIIAIATTMAISTEQVTAGPEPSSGNTPFFPALGTTTVLAEAPMRLDEIISTARGRLTTVGDIPGGVAVVTEEDLRETRPPGVADALSREPGIAVNRSMPWGARPVIRGLTKDHVIMLVDGARVVTATDVPAQFGTVAPGDIEQIEVLKGPLSVLYGSGSTGGVVNVITRSGEFSATPRVNASLEPSFESATGGLSAYGRIGFSASRIYFSLSQAARNYADYRGAGDVRVPNTQFRDRQTQIAAGARFGSHRLDVRWQGFVARDAGIPGGANFPPSATVTYPETTRDLFMGTWTWSPETAWLSESRLIVYHQPVERNVDIVTNTPRQPAQPLPTNPALTVSATPTAITTHADHLVSGARWQNTLAFAGHELVFGVEGWEKHMRSFRTRKIVRETFDAVSGIPAAEPDTVLFRDNPVPDSRQRPIGAFIEDDFPVGENFRVTLGGRIDRIHTENAAGYTSYFPVQGTLLWPAGNDNDTSWSMVAGGIWHLADTVDLSVAAARSLRAPTIEERFLYAQLGQLTVGNPTLDPERGVFLEGGLTASAGGASFDFRGYVNTIENMVILRPGTFLGEPAQVYGNAGKARLAGIELSATLPVTGWFLFGADAAYVRGRDVGDGGNLPLIPPLTGHLSARYDTGTCWAEPVLTLVGRQEQVATKERGTAGYALLDIGGGIVLARSDTMEHSLVAGIRNVFDTAYRDHLTVNRGTDMPGMGRSLYMAWRTAIR